MKKIILLTICITGMLSCNQKRSAVVERPVFEVRNSRTLEIDKIELSDTATIFYIDAYVRPNNWISIDGETYIRESGTNKKLLIIGSEGINLDETTYMPESGTMSFKLFFPPLKNRITKIDFIESDCSDCYKILGIHLLPDEKIKFDPVPEDIVITAAKPLPVPVYSDKPTRINGQLSGYISGMLPDNITVYTTNIITNQRIETELQISDDGTFSGEVIPYMAGIYFSTFGSLFLVPGEEVKIFMDLKKFSRFDSRYRTDKEAGDSIHTFISGYLTKAELDAITQASYNMFDYQELMQETVNMKPEVFKQHILNIMNEQIDKLKQKNYTANAQMLAENNIKLTAFIFLMRYEEFMNAAYIQVNGIDPEEISNITFVPEKPSDDYYSFLKEQINDNFSYLSIFNSLVSYLIDLYELPDGSEKSVKERFIYFKEKIAPVLGTDKGLLFDFVQFKLYGSQIDDMRFFSDAEKQEIQDVFKEIPAYAKALIAENDKKEALLAANKEIKGSILNVLPQASQEKMFDDILSNYKGKVILVDFWATWCAPCMIAMKSILPLKEEMKEKDVVFLYLTGETSPFNDFTRTYPAITGEHYRVSAAQWNYWMRTFNIPGIPAYMIYDRKGKQIARYSGFPGVDDIKKDIEKVL